jgi:hypothetical protein
MLQFCRQNKANSWCPSQPTASRWLKERQSRHVNDTPGRRTRRGWRTGRSGRPRKDVNRVIEVIATGPLPLRKHDYLWFIKEAGVSERTLRRRMKERNPPIIRSRRRRTEEISYSNKQKRVAYGHQFKDETVDTLWRYIHWTDEAHIDKAQAIDQWIFREEGNHHGLVMEQPANGHLVLHIAASVSWFHKSELIFYNDEHWSHGELLQQWKSLKPRRNRRSKSEATF